VAWTPIYIVGLMGTTRRVRHFDDPSQQIWFIIAGIGALIILVGILGFVIQIAVSILKRDKLRDTTGDPWDGRTLEWSMPSPPPFYNFAFTPVVHRNDAWYDMKARGVRMPKTGYLPIHMPRNTGAGVILSALAMVFGFAMIWYMWWLAGLSFLALFVYAIAHTFNYRRDYFVPPEDVARTERLASGA
jgi:cytochrome o ubiquinol oxidase subunit 1